VLKALRKLVRENKKRARKSRADRRRSTLLRAGRQLLSTADYDRIAVSEIAFRADCSVGAFYGRFPTKSHFLSEVIDDTFEGASKLAARDLKLENWRSKSNSAVAHGIATYLVEAMTEETAGVMRAALKMALSDRRALEPVLSYRSVVTNHAVTLIADRAPSGTDATEQARISMQVLHAAVTDMLLHTRGPLRAGSATTIDELSELMIRHLGL
jgi:AcrR family transcriptional regulator